MLATIAPPSGGSVCEEATGHWLRDWWDQHRPGWVDPSWWDLPLRPDVVPLLDMPAGPELTAELARAGTGSCEADHAGEIALSPYPCGCQLVLAAAWRAAATWASVRAAGAITDAVGTEVVVMPQDRARPEIVDPAREELAVALRVSPGSASVAIRRARALAAFPAAVALAQEGLLPLQSVESICAAAERLDPPDADRVIEAWCQKVRGRAAGRRPMTGTGAARVATKLILASPSYLQARQRARADRRVELWPNTDGTATLAATLREEDALRVHRRITAIARGLDDPDDERPLDAKRADILVDLLLGRASTEPSVDVRVIIPVEALLGLADGCAQVDGLGPIPTDIARALAADGKWRGWLTNTDGQVLATTASTYRPPEALARLVRAREPHCRMPGCPRPAEQCDIDHATPWPQGATTASNLGPLCRRHHVLKTHYDWQIDSDGQTWSTPAGATVAMAG